MLGITTTGDYIVVGKPKEIKIFKSKGENIRNIVLRDLSYDSHYVSSLYYNPNNDSILYRKIGLINHIQLDGTLLFSYVLSGVSGLAVDKQGNMYMSEFNRSEIQRFSPGGRIRDVVTSLFYISFKDRLLDNISETLIFLYLHFFQLDQHYSSSVDCIFYTPNVK